LAANPAEGFVMVQRTPWTVADYDKAADAYLASLPLEHFMESIPHARQRKITLGSLEILSAQRAGVQVDNELLVQYFYKEKLRQVVPDNMLRLSTIELKSTRSFNVELESDKPLLVLEYVSPRNKEKDYKDSFKKYERELKVPYCLMYYPEKQDLRVWHHNGKRYERIEANAAGRHPIPELDQEVGIQDGWVRYWYRGELLPLPTELWEERNAIAAERDRLAARADKLAEENARLRALLEEAANPRKKNGV
jgi:Uma2 family endonuclease